MHDLMIIGAGPAGSVAACILARAGWRVTCVEQHRFPREKVCGECLSALGVEVLSRLHLDAAVRAHNPVELARAVIVSADGREAEMKLPARMWGLSRAALD